MKIHRIAVTVVSLLVPLAMAQATVSEAAELKVLCSTPLRQVMLELVPQFERATKHQVIITYGASPELKQKIDSGDPFDVAILTPVPMDALIKGGKIVASSRTSIARTGMGLMIRAGAHKPDVGTTDALKRSLLDAKSITYGNEGASGAYFVALIQRLGVAEALNSKLKIKTSGEQVAEAVANGEAELGVLPVTEILVARGTELLGTFPSEVQSYVVLEGGVGLSAQNATAANDLLKFLASPAALPVINKKGMERN
jgi:molybdate transport system substrate-binding protein